MIELLTRETLLIGQNLNSILIIILTLARSVIPTSLMLKDPDLASFVEEPYVRVWLSPERHLVAYNIVSVQDVCIGFLD